MNDHNEHATENNNGTTGGSGNGGGNGNGANSAQQSQARHSGDDGTPKRKHDGSAFDSALFLMLVLFFDV